MKQKQETTDDDFEIIDPENYSTEQEQAFSHQGLVMKGMTKCLEAGCKEMRSGYWNTRADRFGNIIKNYIEDTRKVFIECVETLEMIMVCDIDEDAKKKIDKLKEDLQRVYKKLLNDEKRDWDCCSKVVRDERIRNGICFREGCLNIKLPYYQDYIEEQVRIAREIVKELTKLTQRLDFYADIGLEM